MKISKYDILIIILIIFIILTLLFTLYSRNELKQKQGFIELYFEDQNSLPEIIEINKPFNVSITIKNNELYLVNYIFEINSEISNYTRDINLSSGESTTIDLEIIPENIGWEIYFKEKRIIKEVLNTIENSKIATPRVFSFFIGDSLYQYSLPLSHYIEGLGYVFHTNLTLEELEEEGVDAVVVDLRNNGGGSLSEANQLVGLFIETGPTVQIRYSGLRNGFTRSFGDNDPEMAYAGPLAVLVNRTSASASEIFAGAIQDYERGIVLGGQTFGKGTVQEIIPMDYGQVKLTRSKFYRISGESTQHRGVVPDISFPDFYDAYEDIGESSLDGALPWDTVRPVEYRHYLAIQEVLPQLQQLHEERAESSADFIYLENQIERTRELRGREEISLNELVVKTEREESRRREFDAENMRRMMKGLPLRDWVDADAEEDEEEVEISANDDVSLVDNSDDEALEDEVEEEKDPLLLESGRVLVDFIALNRGNANSISDTSSRQRPAR